MTRRVDKPWGHEEIWAETDHYVGKILEIRAGERLSLQLHREKDESIRVIRGRLRLELENDAGTLETRELAAGDSAHIRPGRRHRFAGVEDTELVEVSTSQLDDVVRLEDDYGRSDERS